MPVCFLKTGKEGVELDGWGGEGGPGGREAGIRMYCMKNLFSIKNLNYEKARYDCMHL